MRHPILAAAVLSAALAPLVAAAQTAPPSIAGMWTLQFHIQPTLKKGDTQCIVFTQTFSQDGIYSGTWAETTYPISGNWYQKAAQLTIYGNDFSHGEATLMSGLELSSSAAALDNVVDWTNQSAASYAEAELVRVKKCPAVESRRGGLMVGEEQR